MTRRKRSPEENERRAKIRELLLSSNISSMEDIQDLFRYCRQKCCFVVCGIMKKNAQGCFFMENSYRRHDMSDAMWEMLKPYTIGNKGTWGGNAKDTRQFLNGVFWILRTGAPWRDLPPEYGK